MLIHARIQKKMREGRGWGVQRTSYTCADSEKKFVGEGMSKGYQCLPRAVTVFLTKTFFLCIVLIENHLIDNLCNLPPFQ